MKTILRINGTNDILFQTVTDGVPIIKNETIADYSTEFKRFYFDLAKSGDLVKVDFDRDLFNFCICREFGEIKIDTGYNDFITANKFNAMKDSIKLAEKISKKLNHHLLINDKIVIKNLIKAFNVQAVFIEIDGCRKTYSIKEAFNNLDFIFAAIYNSIITE